MRVFPAIDLLGGKVVRLVRGRREEATVFSERPDAVALSFQRAGAERIHVVDLDGAFDGAARNTAAILRILGAVRVPVQVGGGLRTFEACRALMDAGAAFVVLGTAAVRDPDVVRRTAGAFPERVIAAVDARAGRVRIEGWEVESDLPPDAVAARAAELGAAEVLYTDIARDGTREGPNVEATARLAKSLPVPVIASGGIGRIEHVRALAAAGVPACVVGRALYEGAISLQAAIAEARAAAPKEAPRC